MLNIYDNNYKLLNIINQKPHITKKKGVFIFLNNRKTEKKHTSKQKDYECNPLTQTIGHPYYRYVNVKCYNNIHMFTGKNNIIVYILWDCI